MSKKSILIVAVVIIVVNNAVWVMWGVDASISYTYDGETIKQQNQTLDQVFAMLPRVASSGGSRTEILKAASESTQYHKEPTEEPAGAYTVGWIVLTFDGQGRLIKVHSPLGLGTQ